MTYHSLGRKEKGRIAELIARGLYRDPHDLVKETVEEHVHDRYHDLLGDSTVRITRTDINSYRWSDLIPVSVPGGIGWRPDFFVKAEWYRRFSKYVPAQEGFWEADLPPVEFQIRRKHRIHNRFGEFLRCRFTVYYPVEVKSGDKKTLTEQQASAIPDIANHVDHVHPIIVTVEIDNLPDGYSINVEEFATSRWGDNYKTSRYRS